MIKIRPQTINKGELQNHFDQHGDLSKSAFSRKWKRGLVMAATALGMHLFSPVSTYAQQQSFIKSALPDEFAIPASLLALEQLRLPDFKRDTIFIQQSGGSPDGITLNTAVIQKAIDQLSTNGGGVVYVGVGQWLTGPLVLKSNVNLHVAAGGLLQFSSDFDQYPMVKTSYEGVEAVRCQAPVSALNATHIGITGNGIIDGAGDSWRMVKKGKLTESQWKTLVGSTGVVDKAGTTWYPSKGSLKGSTVKDAGVLKAGKTAADYKDIKDYLRPNLLSLINCKQVLLEGVTFQNSPAWCLHPLLCEQVIIRGIYAKNPWYAQNGDGLDLESCKNVLIEHSSFDVGDDGICMKSGRDEEGRKRGVPTENVLVQYATVYHAHGGFVIGSEMSGGVKNVAIRRCSFLGTDIGLRFKTTRGRGGVVENIYASQINMQGIKGDAIRFNMYYAAKDPVPLNGEQTESPKEERQPVTAGTPQFRHFYISDINCNGADHSLFFRGLPEMAIKDIHLRNLVMRTKKGIELIEAKGIDVANLKAVLTRPGEAMITLSNTSSSLFENLDLAQTAAVTQRGSAPHIVVSGADSKAIVLKEVRINGEAASKDRSAIKFGADVSDAALEFK
ncbi:Pectate lyase superfamily protein [Arachidicoccus rhizosphaerae]|uniref:Pectate lyase superfamily protein n=1 Tax=Arachidicoccus rhizosphaerae TaxID=551991 RepID=A0A1H4AR77_9BACT|nr:glycoside hydrolase family 28 protein [Arachidicoccus rhizosphaerae]SEA38308.1 Pectate lyase superfamily protein [Arachidicoccus rhizosphaerae]